MQRIHIIIKGQVRNTRFGAMGMGAAQLFGSDSFMGHGFNHIWPSNKHIAAVLHHKNKVGNRWRVHCTPSTGAHHHADLGDHTTGHHIALKHLGIATQRSNALLNTGTARVVKTNHRCTHFHGLIH